MNKPSLEVREAMRGPVIVFIVLMALLAVNVTLGTFRPHGRLWPLELSIVAIMVSVTILFSMEAVHQVPLIRLFSMLGFVWVGVLFGMTMLDYLAR
jgi:cytochrome c oxidase subunit 4